MCDEALFSWKWLNICLPVGNSECILYFAFLARTAFALAVELFLYQHVSFLTFTLTVLSNIPLQGSEGAAMWCLTACWD